MPEQVKARVQLMEWGPNPRLMCVMTPEGVRACRKVLLNHRFRDNYVVLQVRGQRWVGFVVVVGGLGGWVAGPWHWVWGGKRRVLGFKRLWPKIHGLTVYTQPMPSLACGLARKEI